MPSRTYLRERAAWNSARRRCENPHNRAYSDYGGRGIFMCERWRKSFEAFYEDMGRCPNGYSLDRIDNNGPYSPENCRWATQSQQLRNTRVNRIVTHDGQSLCMVEWAERAGIPWTVLQLRLNAGWTVCRALTTPVRRRRSNMPPITWQGQTRTVGEWSIMLGAGRSGLSQRLLNGWPLERAMTEPFGSYHAARRRT